MCLHVGALACRLYVGITRIDKIMDEFCINPNEQQSNVGSRDISKINLATCVGLGHHMYKSLGWDDLKELLLNSTSRASMLLLL